jgi:hypothetical protein
MPAWHVLPPPQVSVQALLSAARHVPASHTWPAAHGVPQPPQFMTSVSTSAHMPLQNCQPLGHEQASGSMHVPLQSIWGGAQPHAPATHVVPAGQAIPHTPQWAGLVAGSMQKPRQLS